MLSGLQDEFTEIADIVWPDWEIVEKLGTGAFATVFRASRREKITGEKDSAIKIIRIPQDDTDWEQMLAEGKSVAQTREYFQDAVDEALKEIRAMEDLGGHTNIVNIYDYKLYKVPDRDVWYILIRMEYLQKINTESFDEEEIKKLGTDVCTALTICRKKNIVHRDVSLDNIFVRDGNYKLGDFGVAKVLEGTVGGMHSIAGKPLYMAPEVYNATLANTDMDSVARVDLYSLGVLLYRLSNNMKYPFEDPVKENTTASERNEAFRRRVIDGETLPPPVNASPEMAEIILKACEANPDKRYGSAEEFRNALLALKSKTQKPRFPWKKILILFAAMIVLACAWFFGLRPLVFPVWSEWSEWSEIRQEISDPNQMQEEKKTACKWKAVQCPECGNENWDAAETCIRCGTKLPVQFTDDNNGQPLKDNKHGRYFDNKAFLYVDQVMQYRYRNRKQAMQVSENDICAKWYYSTYEDAENYPGIVFIADGNDSYISVYKNADGDYLLENHSDNNTDVKTAVFEDQTLTAGYEKYMLEDGKLIQRYGSVTKTYARKPQDRQIPADRTSAYANYLLPEHYNGTWLIKKYGMNNAFADADTMKLSGKAVIDNGKLSMTWSMNNTEKQLEIDFDQELNKGRLYTVVDGMRSYIVSIRSDHTILLNIGLNQAQWVLQKENAVSEETVRVDSPGFEDAFAENSDWTASEETRNSLAKLLLDTVISHGVDPAVINTDGLSCLALITGDPETPVLVCEGTGDYANYILSVGRGISQETQKPFIYYQWEDYFFSGLLHPKETIMDYYRNEILPLVAENNIWPVEIKIQYD